ncbi:MAG: NAD(+) synthase [Desulfobacteraceae bacterium]|nr:NAD(+) synthase [Desulfobacteraceae bacterium]
MPRYDVDIDAAYWPGKPLYLNALPVQYKRAIDHATVEGICGFIREAMRNLGRIGMDKLAVGLSGGIDSVCVLKLCREALDFSSIIAVIVDLGVGSHGPQTESSIRIARELDATYEVIDASGLLAAYRAMSIAEGPFTRINIITRCIQNSIFQFADSTEAAVVCTSDRSEEALGRHMECFYGHIAPIIGLFKTEVMDLSRIMGIPEVIVRKDPGCADAWLDHVVLGSSYDYIDPILYLLLDRNYNAGKISSEFNIDRVWLEKIEHRIRYQQFRTNTLGLTSQHL